MEPDVVEIPPPVASRSRTLTPKKALPQEVIDVENYEMQNGSVLNHNNVDNKNKGKAIQFESPSFDESLLGVSASDYYGLYGTSNNIESYPGSSSIENGLLDPDSLIYEDDYEDDLEMEVDEEETDEYSLYQDFHDSKDVPTGVEVTMDWFPNSSSSSNKEATKGNGIHPQNSFPAAPVIKPWIPPLPNNSQGVAPSSAYPLPQTIHGFHHSSLPWMYHSNLIQPQTLVMGQPPAPAPSDLLLPAPKKKSGFKSLHMYQPRAEKLSAPDSSRVKRNMEDFLGSYLFFKRFDIVEDYSDHHFASSGSTSKPYTKDWAKRIQEEWRILENDLPELIFVRAYESRMDLLRAVIIGAEGTPYHDGLFFFDIFFPDTYPSVPPSVHYHSRGERINPNLYKCGKVCLSLLGTWTGDPEEQWLSNKSTMLQVLASIQGLILNQKPYFNEPGYEMSAGSPLAESASKTYSENTFLLSLKTMVNSIRTPLKYFEDFSYGHFFSCAHDILKACDAYRNGAPVGSVVKGGVQDVEESSERSSMKFRTKVATLVDTILVKEFILLGVLGLEPEEKEDKPSETNVAESSNSKGSN